MPSNGRSVRIPGGEQSIGILPSLPDREGTVDDSAVVPGVQTAGVPALWLWDEDENLSDRVSAFGISIFVGRPSVPRSLAWRTDGSRARIE